MGSNVAAGSSWAGFRNRIINGDMRIDQANAGASKQISNIGNNQYCVDQWAANGTSTGIFTVQQSTSTPPRGFTNFIRLTTTTADSSPSSSALYYLVNYIEGQTIQDFGFGNLGALPVSLSFWTRSSLTGTFSGLLGNEAGGSSARSYAFTFSIPSANVWTYITITIPGDTTGTWLTTNGRGFGLVFNLGCGSTFLGNANSWSSSNVLGASGTVGLLATNGATLDITGVQLEVGPNATPFETRPFGIELALCQRYYCKSFYLGTAPVQNAGVGTGEARGFTVSAGSTDASIFVFFPVTMRTTSPVVTTYNPANTNAQIRDLPGAADYTGTTTANISDRGLQIFGLADAGSGAGFGCGVHWTADARL